MVGQFEKTRQAENCFPPLPKSKHSRFPHPKKESQVCAPKLGNKTHLFPPASFARSTDRVKQQVVAVEVIVLFSFSSSSFSSKRFKGKRNFQFQEPFFTGRHTLQLSRFLFLFLLFSHRRLLGVDELSSKRKTVSSLPLFSLRRKKSRD